MKSYEISSRDIVKKLSVHATPATSAAPVKRYVTNADAAILVAQNSFYNRTLNGVSIGSLIAENGGICAPTTGTNLIKYWALKRGVTALDCPYSFFSKEDKDWWICSSLMVRMNMDMTTGGVTPSNFYNGLKTYSTSTRGVQWSGADFVSSSLSLTFNKAKSIIDSNVPFGLGVPGHRSSCFGYHITSDGSKQLIINTTGLTKATNSNGTYRYIPAWEFHSFSSLDIQSYIYVRWN